MKQWIKPIVISTSVASTMVLLGVFIVLQGAVVEPEPVSLHEALDDGTLVAPRVSVRY